MITKKYVCYNENLLKNTVRVFFFFFLNKVPSNFFWDFMQDFTNEMYLDLRLEVKVQIPEAHEQLVY